MNDINSFIHLSRNNACHRQKARHHKKSRPSYLHVDSDISFSIYTYDEHKNLPFQKSSEKGLIKIYLQQMILYINCVANDKTAAENSTVSSKTWLNAFSLCWWQWAVLICYVNGMNTYFDVKQPHANYEFSIVLHHARAEDVRRRLHIIEHNLAFHRCNNEWSSHKYNTEIWLRKLRNNWNCSEIWMSSRYAQASDWGWIIYNSLKWAWMPLVGLK